MHNQVASSQEWEAAREQLLVKEKALTRARDALAAERRRMPWLAVEKRNDEAGRVVCRTRLLRKEAKFQASPARRRWPQ